MTIREYDAIDLDGAALVLVDVQRGFDDRRGGRNNPDAERHVAELLSGWRTAGLPVVHLRRDPSDPSSPLRRDRAGHAFKSEAEPLGDEPVITRPTSSGFAGTDLEDRLRDAGVKRLVLVGFATDRAVSSTARTAADLGFETAVVGDASVAFDRTFDGTRYAAEQVHRLTLAQLSDEYATVVEAATLLAALEEQQ